MRGYAKGEYLDWSNAAYPDPYERWKHLLVQPWDAWPGMEAVVREEEAKAKAQQGAKL